MHGPHTTTDRRRIDTDRPRDDAYVRGDASAGWREEYAHQSVEPDLRADGGTTTALPAAGDHVRDREHDGDELLVVAIHPDGRADEHPIPGLDGATVADVNDGYDPAAPVVEAVYLEEVDATLDGWRSVEDVRDAVSFGAVNAYRLPADRLDTTGGGGR
ncbi:hypothetical protein [Halobellus ruber]|uniref:Uncharacterized protein n=1 Tax=Halobellus ruber TaxID=2761102 RepID=A0A7J9SLY6_9EURY|nr:hypothetical protein [Halobellus ruber]MBB6647974.1 hypothetical protein [Halobellus ruber]